MPEIKKFKYHASTLGLSGHIRQPFDQALRPQAAVNLPEDGGFVHEHVTNFNFRDLMVFDRAVAFAAGSFSQKDNAYDATATVSIEGLNLLNVVLADRVTARVASSHPKSGEQPRITPIGCSFENLRIAGYKVEVDLALDVFSELGTCQAFEDAVSNPEINAAAKHLFLGKTALGASRCTLVRDIKGLGKEITVRGNEIQIPGFGVLSLGTIEISERKRKVSMLQFELGSTPAGPGSAGGAEGNGSDN